MHSKTLIKFRKMYLKMHFNCRKTYEKLFFNALKLKMLKIQEIVVLSVVNIILSKNVQTRKLFIK